MSPQPIKTMLEDLTESENVPSYRWELSEDDWKEICGSLYKDLYLEGYTGVKRWSNLTIQVNSGRSGIHLTADLGNTFDDWFYIVGIGTYSEPMPHSVRIEALEKIKPEEHKFSEYVQEFVIAEVIKRRPELLDSYTKFVQDSLNSAKNAIASAEEAAKRRVAEAKANYALAKKTFARRNKICKTLKDILTKND